MNVFLPEDLATELQRTPPYNNKQRKNIAMGRHKLVKGELGTMLGMAIISPKVTV